MYLFWFFILLHSLFFHLFILFSLLKRLCPCSFSHKQQHKHIALTRTLLSIVRIIDFPWHGNHVTVSIHVFFKVTTICALCCNLQLWKGRRKHCSCGRQVQKFTCRKNNIKQIVNNTKHDSKAKLGYATLRMKTLLTLVRRNRKKKCYSTVYF